MVADEAERVGELLLEEGVVTREELAHAIAESEIRGTPLAAALEAQSHVTRTDLVVFLASRYRPPVIDDLRKIDFLEEAIKLVPEEVARRHVLLPVARFGGLLCVAKPNYLNKAAVRDLRRITNLKIKVLQADEDQVLAAIERVYKGRAGELPAPRAALRPPPPLPKEVPPPAEATDRVPFISMSEETEQVAAAPPNVPVLESIPFEIEEVVEVMEAIRIPLQVFNTAAREPFVRLIVNFEEMFKAGRVVEAYRLP